MKVSTCVLALAGMVLANQAWAYEYPLQFTPNPGARGLVVAGYKFSGKTIVGNCSYYTQHGGSGRGGGYHTYTTYYNQTCTWDLYGNLLGVAPGAPTVPAPLYTKGTQTVYARDASGDLTGSDTAYHGGFATTPGAHYYWQTSSAYMVLQQTPYTFTAILMSDGDMPLVISKAEVSALGGRAAVKSTSCVGKIPVGKTCAVTVTYDPTRLISDTGLAYDTLTLGVISDAGQAYDFIQGYTIVLSPNSD